MYFLVCGGNDVDYANDVMHYKLGHCQYELSQSVLHKPSWRYHLNYSFQADTFSIFDPCAYVDAKYESIAGHIDTVISIIKQRFPNAKLYCLSIPIRSNWYPLIINLAKMLDKYVEFVQKVRVCDINQFLLSEHFCEDRVHLNAKGYRVFMDRGVGIVLGVYFKECRRPKSERRDVAVRSRSGRKRLYRSQRKQRECVSNV